MSPHPNPGRDFRSQGRPPSTSQRRDQEEGPSPEEILRSSEKTRFFEGESLRARLLDEEAQAAAKAMRGVTTTQLRRFFEQVSAIRRRLDVDDKEVLAKAAFLKASAAYAAGRERKFSPILQFIVRNVNAIGDKRDFVAFHRHFEAVIAFHKIFAKD